VSLNIIPGVPQLRPLVIGFLPRLPGFDTRSGHVGFMVDKFAVKLDISE
jgi:hypothetical protein